MERTITVKGTGNVSTKPDVIVISFSLEAIDYDYEQTMRFATKEVEELSKAIEATGIDRKHLKTTNFTINTSYESYQDERKEYRRRFSGYICQQDLRLEFDFDTELLGQVLTAISRADTDPTLDVSFSVKDQEAVREELLIHASQNARQKAETLTKAAGVTLGQLVKIDYNWAELQMYSSTNYAQASRHMMLSESSPEFNPEDIKSSDTVTFVWEIV